MCSASKDDISYATVNRNGGMSSHIVSCMKFGNIVYRKCLDPDGEGRQRIFIAFKMTITARGPELPHYVPAPATKEDCESSTKPASTS